MNKYGNFGTEVYEYLQRWYPEYEECHVRWHSCICLLMRNHKLESIASHAVHVWLRDTGVYDDRQKRYHPEGVGT